MDLVGGEQDSDDLHLVEEAGGEEWATRAVAQARREDLFLGRTAFAFEKAAGKAPGCSIFLAIIDREREEVLAGPHGRGDRGGDEDSRFTDGDRDGAVGEFGKGTGGELNIESGNGDSMFLIHGSDGLPCTPGVRASCATSEGRKGGGLRRTAQPFPVHGISTVINRISLPASQTREISV